ncbi:MAG TPA: succinate dehydrogenase cytochrome b subunit [Gemmatimonadaceae bacterium]|nr:succinate dehydrogenase cytochrome b subunit [Gemmatimonadaceae bacterium]
MFAFWRSSIGKKVVMAVTGIILVGFVVGHLLGNLLIFRGPDAVNQYAALLRANMGILWAVRIGLLAAAVLHVVAAVQLTWLDRAARPVGYARVRPQASTFASRTIRWGGLVLALFVVFHLLHLTTGTLHPAFDHTDVYGNMIAGFSVWWVALFYLVAMLALGLHLYHGVWSVGRTLGVAPRADRPLKRRLATVLAIVLWLGFSAIPVAVLAGMVR